MSKQNGSIEDQAVLSLNGKKVDSFKLRIKNISQGRFIEERNFELFLEDEGGNLSQDPVIFGKYFGGRGEWMPIWLEVTIRPSFTIIDSNQKKQNLVGTTFEEDIFKEISYLIPPGGRIFVMYTTTGTDLTRNAYERGIPRMLTPLGFLLWKNGFRWFKDWYYAEGWSEGGQKLQGNKPLNKEVQKKREIETIVELKNFLDKKHSDDTLNRRAQFILDEIGRTWCK